MDRTEVASSETNILDVRKALTRLRVSVLLHIYSFRLLHPTHAGRSKSKFLFSQKGYEKYVCENVAINR